MFITFIQSLSQTALARRRRRRIAKSRGNHAARNPAGIECLEQRILLSNNPLDEVEPNDNAAAAQALPLGFDAGEQAQLVVGGSIDAVGDQDWYKLQLNAGDVLGVTVQGNNQLDTTLSLLDFDDELLIYNDDHQILAHNYYLPNESPLPNLNSENSEDSLIQYVINTEGTYYLKVDANSGSTGDYKLNAVVARPRLEYEPIGAHQILFVDLDGVTVNMSKFGGSGTKTLSPLRDFLHHWDLDASHEDAVIDAILANIEENLVSDIKEKGLNPEFDLEIRNSRDHADEFGSNPYMSRVIIGGSRGEAGIPYFAIAEHVDVGNFSLNDDALVTVDRQGAPAGSPGTLNGIPLAPKRDRDTVMIELIGEVIGRQASHEAGHNFGNYHTDRDNDVPNVMDQGGLSVLLGRDGYFGTRDDLDIDYGVDVYAGISAAGFQEPFENTGVNDTLNTIAFGLTTGQATAAAGATVDSATTSLSNSGTVALQTLSTSADQSIVSGVSVIDDFAGRSFVDESPERVVPPDTHLAVGQKFIVETVNRYVAIYNKQSGQEIKSEPLDEFFAEAGAGEPDPPNGVMVGFDPKVVYDEVAERFVVTALERNPLAQTSHLLIAVSNGPNPMDGWEKQRIDAEDAEKYWADYTALGWDADGYYVSVNMFEWGGSYHHHSIFTFDKSSLIDGDDETVTYFDVDRNISHFTMWPALMHGAEPGDPMYFVEHSASYVGSTIRVVRMTDKITAEPIFKDFTVHVPNYTFVVNPTQPDGGNFHITNIGQRILSAAWRNDRLVTGHHVGSDGLARARWYEIDTSRTKPSLVQTGEIDPGSAIHSYMPSLDIAPNGDIGLTYLQSSTDSGDSNGDGFKDGYLSMYVTGRKADDPLGTMRAPVLVKAGEATYTVEDQIPDFVVDAPPYRVGDFSGLVVDPVDGTFWAANEYATAPLPPSPIFVANWGTWIANFEITDDAAAVLTSGNATQTVETSGDTIATESLVLKIARPFMASFTSELGEFVQDPDDPFTFHATATGQATHLGRFELTSTIVFSPDFSTFMGIAYLTANRGQLVIETSGTDMGDAGIGTYQIVEGTGRFTSASGTGDFSIVLNADGSRTASLDGDILYNASDVADSVGEVFANFNENLADLLI